MPVSFVLKNGSNKRFSTSGGMPLPLSATSKNNGVGLAPVKRGACGRGRAA